MKKYSIIILAIAMLISGGAYTAHAYITQYTNSINSPTYYNYDFFVSSTTAPSFDSVTYNATSTSIGTTTSAATIIPYIDINGRYDAGWMNIAGAKAVTFYFSTQGSSTQSAQFLIQVTPDGTTWVPYNTLIQNLASTTYPGVTVATQTVTSTSTIIDSMALQNMWAFQGVRCSVFVTNAATSTCKASAVF